jgi:hypothetical protein
VHVELGVIGLAIGAMLTLLDLALWASLDTGVVAWQELQALPLWRDWLSWLPSLWVFVPPLVAWGIVLGLAFQAIALIASPTRRIEIGVYSSLLSWRSPCSSSSNTK